jgi:pimeloyl-ACP methyl ester carboxylesterase
MTSTHTAWTGMLPVDDTALYVNDTGGPGQPVVYLNGAYADQSHWKRVIADFGTGYRHITYDQRARGKSGRSTDYSFRLHESGSSGNCQGRQYTGYQGTTIEYQWAMSAPA